MVRNKLASILDRNAPAFTIGVLAASVYWFGIMRHIELPGLYMDAINPDYLAARILNPGLSNPVWILPTKWFPILGNLYHGVQNLYVGIPLFWAMGTNVVSARIAQAIFGSAITVMVYFLVLRITKARLLAFGAALCLATDIAFIASFRTQNYIILGGLTWLLLAVLPLVGNCEHPFSKKRLLASGAFFGLAAYGYFVHTFFFPVFIYGAMQTAGKGRRLSGAFVWCVGVLFGLLPYVFGYLSMGLALGGVREWFLYVKTVAERLEPFSSDFSLAEKYQYAFTIAKVAMTNAGNESMIFGDRINAGCWPDAKFTGGVVIVVLLVLCGLYNLNKRNRARTTSGFLLVLLPCSYFLFAGFLGNRLWAHHYSVLTPFLYILGALLIDEGNQLLKAPNSKVWHDTLKQLVAAFVFVAVLVLNCNQQNSFFKLLDHTGGAGKMSNALTLFANEALSNPSPTVYLFPEWGFFMPFSFLTANRIPYRLDMSKAVIDEFRGKCKQVSVAFWEANDVDKYREQLRSFGIENALLRVYTRRDTLPAFYLLTAPL